MCFEDKAQAGGEPHRPEHAQVVLAEANVGPADGADDARAEVVLAADVINDAASGGVVKHAVDGKIAAVGVFAGGGEVDGIGAAAVGVSLVAELLLRDAAVGHGGCGIRRRRGVGLQPPADHIPNSLLAKHVARANAKHHQRARADGDSFLHIIPL